MRSKNSSINNSAKNKTAQLRIIGGTWRGRKLVFTAEEGLRPTGDRLRETLFNWLAPYINGARCLDLFAGSGALGIEALSRGAAEVVFVDQSTQAVGHIRDNLSQLKVDNASVIQADASGWLAQVPQQRFDIVFVDPPFALQLLAPSLEQLADTHCLAEEALIYVEWPKGEPQPPIHHHWQWHRHKASGEVQYGLITTADTR